MRDDGLGFEIVVERVVAHLPAPTRLLVAAERHRSVKHAVTVDPHRAGPQTVSRPVRLAYVARPDPRREAVVRVVAAADNVIALRIERNRAHHRPEDLLAHHLHVGRGVSQHGRLHEVPALARPTAAGRRAGASVKTRGQVTEHLVVLLGRDQRPHLVISVEPRTDLDLLGLIRNALHDLVIHITLDVQPRPSVTALALVKEDPVRRTRDRHVHVSILIEHLRTLATQLKRDLLEIARRRLHDQPPHLGRARERNLVNTVMSRERRTRVTEPSHNIDHTRRQPSLQHQLTQPQRRKRRLLSRLEHHRHTSRQRRAKLPRRHQQRKIPRNDLPNHTHRLLARISKKLRPRRSNSRNRDRTALDLRRPTRHVMKQISGQRNIRLATLRRCHPTPIRTLIIKTTTSRSNRQLNILGRAIRHPPKTLLRRRIERLKGLPAQRLHPLTINQQTTRLTNELLDLLSR